MRDPIRLLVVEDEPLYRDGLCSQISECPGMEVVGAASDGVEAIEMAERLDPDAVLMDIELGGEPNGIQAGQAIKAASPFTGIVLLSAHNDKQFLAVAERSGGWSYLLKKNVPDVETLIDAVEGSIWGKVVVDPQVIAGLTPRPGSRLSELPEEQLKILELLGRGYIDSVIAEKLQLVNGHAVREHLAEIYQVLEIEIEGELDPKVKAVLTYLDQTRVR